MMNSYIQMYQYEDVETILEEFRTMAAYGISDPRMAPRIRKQMEEASENAVKKLREEWDYLDDAIRDYLKEHNNKIPYIALQRLLSYSFLGGTYIEPEMKDNDYPFRSSRCLSVMFWNLGQWCRTNFNKCPLPPQLEKFRPYVDYSIDDFGRDLDLNDRPQAYNYFTNSIKQLGAHIFLNCEACSLFVHKDELEENGWTTCFNDYTDFMCAARLGQNGSIRQIAGPSTGQSDTRERYVSWAIFEIVFGVSINRQTQQQEPLTRAQMKTCRVYIYHVDQKRVSSSASVAGEAIAVMTWECMKYQVDIMCGDGNKAAYLATSGIGKHCVPSYQDSLLQFWINRLVKVAAFCRERNYHDKTACPVRVKHFISASFDELTQLTIKLAKVKTENYKEKLAKETEGLGDCCMLSIIEWGHSRWEHFEDIKLFDDETHRDAVGEFFFKVNEQCLHNDHNLFLIGPTDKDSHNPLLIHFEPSTLSWKDKKEFKTIECKKRKKESRKERQAVNRRKGRRSQEEEEDDDDDDWLDP